MTIDTSVYFPTHIQNIDEFEKLIGVFDSTIAACWTIADKELNNEFLTTMDEDACTRQETMLGISYSANDSLDDRRRRIIGYYASDLPYTKKKLDEAIKSMCGEDYYTLEIDTTARTVTVRLAMESENMVDIVQEILDRMIPANMVVSITEAYNRYKKFLEMTWGDLSSYTWYQARAQMDIE